MSDMDGKESVRILIVEDSDDDVVLLVSHMERTGLAVQWRCVDSPEGLHEALKQDWDIVLSDYTMPKFSGIDALSAVREHDADIPFIFVSGTIGAERAVAALKAGAQDYVLKDHLVRLTPAVERALAEARARRERKFAEDALRKLSQVVEQATESVVITDHEGRIEYVNPAFEKRTGYTNLEVRGHTPDLIESTPDVACFLDRVRDSTPSGTPVHEVATIRTKDGGEFSEQRVIKPLINIDGNISNFVLTGHDVTAGVRAERVRRRLVTILEATPDVVVICSPDGNLQYVNNAGRQLMEVDAEQSLASLQLDQLYAADEKWSLCNEAMVVASGEGVWTGESQLRGPGGMRIPVSQVVVAHRSEQDDIEFFSIIARDIRERKRFEAELRYQSSHDSLTGLANRLLLYDRLESGLTRARRGEFVAAILHLDINKFKRVNDSLGPAAGDALLRQIAHRLEACVRVNDTLARTEGDEFVILAGELTSDDDVVSILHKLRSTFITPHRVAGRDIYITFSVGIALYPRDGSTGEDLLRNAATATTRAKAAGGGEYRFYAPEMNERANELLALEAGLRVALERDEFELHYQPQMNISDGRIVSVEGLLRWKHPDLGLLAPGAFMPLLEETGLIIPVGEWVLRQACADARQWALDGFSGLSVAVNVASRQFMEEQFVDMVLQVLREEHILTGVLELEITEGTVMEDVQAAASTLEALDAAGVRLAIDDFGTGYSSMAYLKRFPLDTLKIDREFIKDLPDDRNGSAITTASATLAHALGLSVVAEGVETAAQLRFLHDLKCDVAQGYHISHALPRSELLQWLRKRMN